MVKKVLLSLCVFSSIGLAQDFSSIFLLKPLEIIGFFKYIFAKTFRNNW